MASPQEISFQYRKTFLHVTLLESFVNGLYLCIVAATLYIMVAKRRIRSQKVMAPLIVIMYCLATIHLALRWRTVGLGFIENGQTEDTVFAYLVQPSVRLQALQSTTVVVNTLIADCILIWRCWKVWGNDWRAPLLPAMTTVVGTVFAILTLIDQAQPDRLSRSGLNASLIYFSLSLVTTMIATILIVFRIVIISWSTGDIRRYRTLVEMIVESAAIYSITLLIYISLLPSTNFADAYPQVILVSVTGIAPTLIAARVCLGLSRPDEQWTRTRSSIFSATQVEHDLPLEFNDNRFTPSGSPKIDKDEFKEVHMMIRTTTEYNAV